MLVFIVAFVVVLVTAALLLSRGIYNPAVLLIVPAMSAVIVFAISDNLRSQAPTQRYVGTRPTPAVAKVKDDDIGDTSHRVSNRPLSATDNLLTWKQASEPQRMELARKMEQRLLAAGFPTPGGSYELQACISAAVRAWTGVDDETISTMAALCSDQLRR